MMIDAQHLFSDAQAVTADAVGTNVIDLSADRTIEARAEAHGLHVD